MAAVLDGARRVRLQDRPRPRTDSRCGRSSIPDECLALGTCARPGFGEDVDTPGCVDNVDASSGRRLEWKGSFPSPVTPNEHRT